MHVTLTAIASLHWRAVCSNSSHCFVNSVYANGVKLGVSFLHPRMVSCRRDAPSTTASFYGVPLINLVHLTGPSTLYTLTYPMPFHGQTFPLSGRSFTAWECEVLCLTGLERYIVA
jgi:hypothetical protein